jgi:hypothetical protein
VALCLGAAGVGYGQFTSFSDRSRVMLEGNWQSCRGADGEYAERIYDGKAPGLGAFEFHMGPYREFALFRGVQDEHRDHASSENLLRPSTVALSGRFARQQWDVADLHLEVALAGGSLSECVSWWITLRLASPTSSH